MADNKQYTTQVQDNGSVLISEDVLATIVTLAVKDVEGVAGLCTKPGADIADMIGKKNWGKGLRILIADASAVVVDCDLTVVYGQSVVGVAKAAQEAIASALESTAGVTVSAVNVNVCGIVRQ